MWSLWDTAGYCLAPRHPHLWCGFRFSLPATLPRRMCCATSANSDSFWRIYIKQHRKAWKEMNFGHKETKSYMPCCRHLKDWPFNMGKRFNMTVCKAFPCRVQIVKSYLKSCPIFTECQKQSGTNRTCRVRVVCSQWQRKNHETALCYQIWNVLFCKPTAYLAENTNFSDSKKARCIDDLHSRKKPFHFWLVSLEFRQLHRCFPWWSYALAGWFVKWSFLLSYEQRSRCL